MYHPLPPPKKKKRTEKSQQYFTQIFISARDMQLKQNVINTRTMKKSLLIIYLTVDALQMVITKSKTVAKMF